MGDPGTLRYDSMQKLMEAIDAPLPESTIGEDNEGQIVVYTGLMENQYGEIVVFPGEGPLMVPSDSTDTLLE